MSGHPDDTSHLTASQVAEAFGCSVRTARRHLARGTLPDHRRTTGADGKTYPSSFISRQAEPRPFDDLVMARNAIRRVARQERFSDVDLAELQVVAAEAKALAEHWNEVAT